MNAHHALSEYDIMDAQNAEEDEANARDAAFEADQQAELAAIDAELDELLDADELDSTAIHRLVRARQAVRRAMPRPAVQAGSTEAELAEMAAQVDATTGLRMHHGERPLTNAADALATPVMGGTFAVVRDDTSDDTSDDTGDDATIGEVPIVVVGAAPDPVADETDDTLADYLSQFAGDYTVAAGLTTDDATDDTTDDTTDDATDDATDDDGYLPAHPEAANELRPSRSQDMYALERYAQAKVFAALPGVRRILENGEWLMVFSDRANTSTQVDMRVQRATLNVGASTYHAAFEPDITVWMWHAKPRMARMVGSFATGDILYERGTETP